MLAGRQMKRLAYKSPPLESPFDLLIAIGRSQINTLHTSNHLRIGKLPHMSQQYTHLIRCCSFSSNPSQNVIEAPAASAVATNLVDNTYVEESQQIVNFGYSTSYTQPQTNDKNDVGTPAKDAQSLPKKWHHPAAPKSTSLVSQQYPLSVGSSAPWRISGISGQEPPSQPAHTSNWRFEAKSQILDTKTAVKTELVASPQHKTPSTKSAKKSVSTSASKSVNKTNKNRQSQRYTLEDLEMAQRGVESSFARNDPSGILRRLGWGFALNMEFTSSRTCAAGLWACEEMMHSPMASSELAYWLLRQLRHLQGSVGGGVPMDSVLRALKIAEREGHAHIMIREINTCKDQHGYLSADICRVALTLLMHRRRWVVPMKLQSVVGEQSKVLVDVLVTELRARYTEQTVSRETLQMYSVQEQARIQDIYDSILGYYARAGRRVEFKDVLKDYERLGLAPPPTAVCKMLLLHSAWCNDTALSFQVVGWLLDPSRPAPAHDETKVEPSKSTLQSDVDFESPSENEPERNNRGLPSEAPTLAQGQSNAKRWTKRNPLPAPSPPTDSIDLFTIRRVLKCAVSNKDKELAAAAFKLFPKYQPHKEVAPVEYANCARVYLRDGDVSGAMEFLLMAEAAGVDFLKFSTAEWRWERESKMMVPADLPTEGKATSNALSSSLGLQLQSDICACFETSVRRLDDMYYMLLDLHRAGHKAPLVMLHAMIMAAGRVGQLDRAFATFRELRSLFGKVPVVQSYNALLFAVAHSTYARVSAMLPVLQGMEADGFTPDDTSFSYLIQLMADTNDIQGYGEVLSHVKERGLQPTPQPLRRICVALARAGDWARVEDTLTLLNNPRAKEEDFDRDPAPRYFFRRLQYFREVQGLDLKPEWPEPLGVLIPNIDNGDNSNVVNTVINTNELTNG